MAKFVSGSLTIDRDRRRTLNNTSGTYQDWVITNSLGGAPIDLREWADATATVYFDDNRNTKYRWFNFEVSALLELPLNTNTTADQGLSLIHI